MNFTGNGMDKKDAQSTHFAPVLRTMPGAHHVHKFPAWRKQPARTHVTPVRESLIPKPGHTFGYFFGFQCPPFRYLVGRVAESKDLWPPRLGKDVCGTVRNRRTTERKLENTSLAPKR